MPRAAGSCDEVAVNGPAALIRAWAAYQLLHVGAAPGTVAGRCQILARVLADYEEDGHPAGNRGLFTAPPETVALHFFGRRFRSNRRERNTRRMESAIEDFRAWLTIQQNRGI